jgi:hypothetical protein
MFPKQLFLFECEIIGDVLFAPSDTSRILVWRFWDGRGDFYVIHRDDVWLYQSNWLGEVYGA